MATILDLNTISLPLENEDILHIFQYSAQEDKKIAYGTLKETMTGAITANLAEADSRLSEAIQSVSNTLQNVNDTLGMQIQSAENRLGARISTEEQRAASEEASISSKLNSIIGDDENKTIRQIAKEVSATVYTPKGSVSFSNLPTLNESEIGWVYNVVDDFVTTSDFREGAGVSVVAGMNVVCAEDSGSKKWDLLGGKVDLSPYQKKSLTTPITVDGVSRATVESAMEAVNALASSTKTSFLKSGGTAVVMYPSESDLPSEIDFEDGIVVAAGTVAWCVSEKTWHKVASVNQNTLAVIWESYDPHIQADIDLSGYKKYLSALWRNGMRFRLPKRRIMTKRM